MTSSTSSAKTARSTESDATNPARGAEKEDKMNVYRVKYDTYYPNKDEEEDFYGGVEAMTTLAETLHEAIAKVEEWQKSDDYIERIEVREVALLAEIDIE